MRNPARPGIKSAVIVALAFGAAAFAFVGPTVTVLVAMLIGGLIGMTLGNVRFSVLALALPAVTVQACGSEVKTRQTSEPLCEPGRSESCTGPAGCVGAQVCDDDGGGWGACECETPLGSDGGGSISDAKPDTRCAYSPPRECWPVFPERCNDAGICGETPEGSKWLCSLDEVPIYCDRYNAPGCRLSGAGYWCCSCVAGL